MGPICRVRPRKNGRVCSRKLTKVRIARVASSHAGSSDPVESVMLTRIMHGVHARMFTALISNIVFTPLNVKILGRFPYLIR